MSFASAAIDDSRFPFQYFVLVSPGAPPYSRTVCGEDILLRYVDLEKFEA